MMNFQDYLNRSGHRREDLLARMALSLELDETRAKRMESAYKAIYKVLESDEEFFSKVDFTVYPQGSVAIGTTTKPRGKDEFDLDIVVHIEDPYYNYSAYEIYNHLIRVLSNNETYKQKLEKKNRCARINYEGDFHMDILPGCIVVYNEQRLKVPDILLKGWSSSFPKGYISWFDERANMVKVTLLEKAFTSYSLTEAKSEQEDLPNESLYRKKPLKRAIQLTKRYRDIFFEDEPKYRTSSIILTTLFGELYNGESSIYETIDGILDRVIKKYTEYQHLYESRHIYKRIKVFNPVNPEEDFTEKWDKHEQYYHSFIDFVKSFKSEWERLKNGNLASAETLFGSSRAKKVLSEQFEKLSSNSGLERAALTALSGKGRVDNYGNLVGRNKNSYPSKTHRNYGIKEIRTFDSEYFSQKKPLLSLQIQQYYIQKNFSWLDTFISDEKLYCSGTLRPEGCKSKYQLIMIFDLKARGRKERVYIRNNSKIKFGEVPHLYPDDSLCLYYPLDIILFQDFNFIDIVPWVSEWLVMYEVWMKYGVWLADEVKH